MAEKIVNHIISAVQIAVGWLNIGIQVETAVVKGLNTLLEDLKLKEG